MMEKKEYQVGDQVFVIYRNPHTANVANIKSAEIVQHPDNPNEQVLFLHNTLHVIEDDDAIFHSYEEAEKTYNAYFSGDHYEG